MDEESAAPSRLLGNEFITYPSRWTALAIYCSLNFVNSMLFVTFVAISNLAAEYIGGFYGNEASVNMLATVFLIFFGPATVLSSIVLKRFGMRHTILIAGTKGILACVKGLSNIYLFLFTLRHAIVACAYHGHCKLSVP